MSVTVDTNILVYATDTGSDVGEAARELVERLARGPGLFYVFWPALMGFVRVATHPAINERPLTPAEAVGSVRRSSPVRTCVLPERAQNF